MADISEVLNNVVPQSLIDQMLARAKEGPAAQTTAGPVVRSTTAASFETPQQKIDRMLRESASSRPMQERPSRSAIFRAYSHLRSNQQEGSRLTDLPSSSEEKK